MPPRDGGTDLSRPNQTYCTGAASRPLLAIVMALFKFNTHHGECEDAEGKSPVYSNTGRPSITRSSITAKEFLTRIRA